MIDPSKAMEQVYAAALLAQEAAIAALVDGVARGQTEVILTNVHRAPRRSHGQ